MIDAATDNTRRIFTESSLYYAKPSTFNDPFDAQVNVAVASTKEEAVDRHWRTLRDRARARGAMVDSVHATYVNATRNVERLYDKVKAGTHIDHARYFRDMIDTLGIVALAENRDNLLLWAHYGSDHFGLCLGFEWDETGLPGAEEVVYQTKYRTLEYYSHTEDEMAAISLLQKSADWAYENEWRSVARPDVEYVSKFIPDEHYKKEFEQLEDKDPDDYFAKALKLEYTFLIREVKKLGSGPKKFNRSSLKEVIFGMRMTKAEVDAQKTFILGCGFTPKFFVAQKHPKRYQLEILPLS